MNTQNTPVHIKLWHRDFWLMAISSLLLTMSIYILIPILPLWMMDEQHFSPVEVGRSMGVFGLGLYLMGALCSWLVQRYRRNVVCMWSMVALIVNIALLWYIDAMHKELAVFSIIMLHRFLLGATFGLAQMVLSSTLIIDTCESFQRTEANHSASWFARFALSLGPLAGLIVYALAGFRSVVLGAVGCAVCALLLVKVVTFPFRTPEEGVKVVSLDRFFLLKGWAIGVNAVLFGICYVLASGDPAVGYSGAKLPTATELKMTDTILNMAYIVGAAAILSIICGEVLMTIRNKK